MGKGRGAGPGKGRGAGPDTKLSTNNLIYGRGGGGEGRGAGPDNFIIR